ncbi:MAG: SDR family oxidoreductase [Vicinamibacterales bacterium]
MNITNQTRIYIAGCGGMLGDAVHAHFSAIANVLATDLVVNEPWLRYADVRDYHAMRASIVDFSPAVIINLAAITDLELCERDPNNAWLTNALGAENLGLVANELDVPYIYISTAGVFDGRLESYSDFDTPNPLGVYGRSKLHGEAYVCQTVRRHYVPRAGWMMGGGPLKDKKFINKIYRQIVAGKTELFVVDDKAGTPTYTVDFAAGLERLLASDMYGLYNHSGQGKCSRYEVACEFVSALGLAGKIKITKVDSSHFSAEYFAARPASEALVNVKLAARGFEAMRDWQACVREYAQVFTRDLVKHGEAGTRS